MGQIQQNKKPQKKIKMGMPRNGEYVQVYGRKKTASAVALCKAGKGLIKVNGRPLDKIEPAALRLKLEEPLLVVGKERFAEIDIKIKVSGGGRVAQIYAIRQAIARSLVAYYQNTSTSTVSESSRTSSSSTTEP